MGFCTCATYSEELLVDVFHSQHGDRVSDVCDICLQLKDKVGVQNW